MKIYNTQSNINFNGYKNLICNSYEALRHNFSFMSMQLDNNEVSDLEDWKLIQKELFKRKNISDVITFQCINYDKYCFDHFMGEYSLSPKLMNPSNEKVWLKAHSLMASLTRRVLENSLTESNSNMPNVLIETRSNLNKFLPYNVEDLIDQILYGSFFKKISDNKIAALMNDSIQKNMIKYFKIKL